MADSPTSRCLEWLRLAGFTAEKVEQRLPIPGQFVTRDFGGFADIIAYSEDRTIAVQACSTASVRDRWRKCAREPRALKWVTNIDRELWVFGWRKSAKNRWVPTILKLRYDDERLEAVYLADDPDEDYHINQLLNPLVIGATRRELRKLKAKTTRSGKAPKRPSRRQGVIHAG